MFPGKSAPHQVYFLPNVSIASLIEGLTLFCRNPDQPGMIGRVGTILGKARVNIRHMDVGPIIRTPRPLSR